MGSQNASQIFFFKKVFFFNSPKIFAIINVRANENIPFLIFITKVFQNLQKMMISEKLGFFDTLASAKFVMQKKKKKHLSILKRDLKNCTKKYKKKCDTKKCPKKYSKPRKNTKKIEKYLQIKKLPKKSKKL